VNRILNGRLYSSTVAVEDPNEIGERVPVFTERAGFYYQRWDELFSRWRTKMEAVTRELSALEIPAGLPEVEDASITTDAVGISSGYRLLNAYSQTVESVFLAYQYHFEMQLFGYGAYLNLFQFCKEAFPSIDDQTIASMAAGADILMFRPDDELKKLARLALDLGIEGRLRAPRRPEDIVAELRKDDGARPWVEAFDAAQDPWFHFSSGTGLYHNERSWVDDLSTPWPVMLDYADRLERGESVDRPREEVLERRAKLTEQYAQLLPDAGDRQAFVETVELARMVAAYVEDHNFYIEHWHHTVFWNKVREFGAVAADRGFLPAADDLFYLNRWEVGQMLYDMTMSWASGGPGRPRHWTDLTTQRHGIVEALRAWSPEPALGPVPNEISEPFTIMLWGITDERIDQWLSSDADSDQLSGFAGSPGVAEGNARVLSSASELATVEDGEIIVCPVTAPSWGPVFGRIAAAVTDTGGIMCHAAIVCREYGLPAVVGTGHGTRRIKTGDRIRVDGNTGTVTILEGAAA
jgi:pyruvate, water dikinase